MPPNKPRMGAASEVGPGERIPYCRTGSRMRRAAKMAVPRGDEPLSLRSPWRAPPRPRGL